MNRFRAIVMATSFLFLACTVEAQVNSWTDGSDKWENAADWSLGVAPSSSDFGDYVTNANTKTVTIDAMTVSNALASLTISNLTVSAPLGSASSVFVNNAGLTNPLTVLNTLAIDTNGAVIINNSAVQTYSNLIVGITGINAVLAITNGGAVSSAVGYVGASGGTSNNVVVVSDTGSVWSNTGTLTVGYSDNPEAEPSENNQLIITNGGTVFNGDGYIGINVDKNNVVVSGNGSLWKNNGNLYVGYDNEGWDFTNDVFETGNTLTVSNGGAVYSSNGAIGNPGGGYTTIGIRNAVMVTGSGSVWSNSGSVYVGGANAEGGYNSLTCAQGGTVYSADAYVGWRESREDWALVTDTGSVWRVAGKMYIVYDGEGSLTISNGGAVYCDSALLFTEGTAYALVTGPGSIWQISGLLNVGWSDGWGNEVIISDGGTVYSSGGYLGGLWNSITVTGGGSVWYNDGDFELGGGYGGRDAMLIADGGKVFNASGMCGKVGVTVTGSRSAWNNNGDLSLSSDGTLTVRDNAEVVASNMYLEAKSGLSVISGGTLYVTNGLNSGVFSLSGGILILNGGTATVDSLVATSGVTFNGGLLNSGGTIVTNGSVFSVGDGTDAATFHLLGGVHSFANDLEISNNAALSGCGTVNGNVVVDPGGSVLANCGATLDFTGIVTNIGNIFAVNGTTVNFYGPVVNNGLIDASNGHVQFWAGVQNSGTITTNAASTLRITAITKQGNDIRVAWACEGGSTYVLQSTKSTAMIAQYNTNFFDASPIILASGVGPSTTNYLDVGAAYAPVLTAPGGQMSTTSTVPSMVDFSAIWTRGLVDSLGQALPMGSLLMLGTFSISDATIQSNFLAGNLTAIMSAFTPYTNAFAVGDGTSFPASWDVSLSAAGFSGQQIYLLAVDAPTLAAANEMGIFTAPSWVFPDDGCEIAIDLDSATDFVIGAQGGPLTINLILGGETYTFTDTARLSVLPGRILFYRVRLAQ